MVNTTSTPTGWKDWVWVCSYEVLGKGYVNTKISHMASIGAICTSTYHTKQLNPWPNSSASHVVNYVQLAVCLSRGHGTIWRQPEHLRTSDKPQKQDTAKAAWAILSVNTWLNCKSMCKAIIWWWKVCLAIMCVEAGFSQI